MQASEGGTLAVELVPAAVVSVGMQLTVSEVSPAACGDTAASAWKGAAAYKRIAASGWQRQQPRHLQRDMHAVVAAAAVAVLAELIAAVVGSRFRL